MFFVFNKDKIKAYLVSVGTVVILFIFSIILSKNPGNVAISTAAYYNEEKTETVTGVNNYENGYNSINEEENINNIVKNNENK